LAQNPKPKTLSAMERHFAMRFVQTGNATQSAREAGYGEKAARQTGYELRALPRYQHVQDFIESLSLDHLALIKKELPASLHTLVRQRDFNPGRLKDEDGEWKNWSDLDPEDLDCITECHTKTYEGGGSTRVKWANKQLAATKIIDWTLRHSDNSKKETESEIKAQLQQRLQTLVAEEFPEEDLVPQESRVVKPSEEGEPSA
jgi:hypothetical protein